MSHQTYNKSNEHWENTTLNPKIAEALNNMESGIKSNNTELISKLDDADGVIKERHLDSNSVSGDKLKGGSVSRSKLDSELDAFLSGLNSDVVDIKADMWYYAKVNSGNSCTLAQVSSSLSTIPTNRRLQTKHSGILSAGQLYTGSKAQPFVAMQMTSNLRFMMTELDGAYYQEYASSSWGNWAGVVGKAATDLITTKVSEAREAVESELNEVETFIKSKMWWFQSINDGGECTLPQVESALNSSMSSGYNSHTMWTGLLKAYELHPTSTRQMIFAAEFRSDIRFLLAQRDGLYYQLYDGSSWGNWTGVVSKAVSDAIQQAIHDVSPADAPRQDFLHTIEEYDDDTHLIDPTPSQVKNDLVKVFCPYRQIFLSDYSSRWRTINGEPFGDIYTPYSPTELIVYTDNVSYDQLTLEDIRNLAGITIHYSYTSAADYMTSEHVHDIGMVSTLSALNDYLSPGEVYLMKLDTTGTLISDLGGVAGSARMKVYDEVMYDTSSYDPYIRVITQEFKNIYGYTYQRHYKLDAGTWTSLEKMKVIPGSIDFYAIDSSDIHTSSTSWGSSSDTKLATSKLVHDWILSRFEIVPLIISDISTLNAEEYTSALKIWKIQFTGSALTYVGNHDFGFMQATWAPGSTHTGRREITFPDAVDYKMYQVLTRSNNTITYGNWQFLQVGARVPDNALVRTQHVETKHILAVYHDGTYQVDPTDAQLHSNLEYIYSFGGAGIVLERYESYWYQPAPPSPARIRNLIINSDWEHTFIYETYQDESDMKEANLYDVLYTDGYTIDFTRLSPHDICGGLYLDIGLVSGLAELKDLPEGRYRFQWNYAAASSLPAGGYKVEIRNYYYLRSGGTIYSGVSRIITGENGDVYTYNSSTSPYTGDNGLQGALTYKSMKYWVDSSSDLLDGSGSYNVDGIVSASAIRDALATKLDYETGVVNTPAWDISSSYKMTGSYQLVGDYCTLCVNVNTMAGRSDVIYTLPKPGISQSTDKTFRMVTISDSGKEYTIETGTRTGAYVYPIIRIFRKTGENLDGENLEFIYTYKYK